jgi:cell wall-associated NlpC family hydrolase
MMSYPSARSRGLVPRFAHLEKADLLECEAVVYESFTHLGKSYRITRELQAGLIDCSTLVSQSHWVGAAVQMPFIAETQRTAVNGYFIDRSDLSPGDCIYAYPTKDEAPGGRHNHVVLFIGADEAGKLWAIESRPESGVGLVELSSVSFRGGIKRFCPEPMRSFGSGHWTDLATRVPKLGRLGARLTSRYHCSSVSRHAGTDIYGAVGSIVLSPFTGVVSWLQALPSGDKMVHQWSESDSLFSVLGPFAPTERLKVGARIERGEILGRATGGASPTGCNAIPGHPRSQRLHWELWAPERLGQSPAPGLAATVRLPPASNGETLVAQNAVYQVKRDTVGPCLKWQA